MSLSSVVFHHPDKSRYSIHALLGAMEVDARFDAMPIHLPEREDHLLDCLKSMPDTRQVLIGMAVFTSQVRKTRHFVEKIRALAPHAFLLAGGPHPTAAPEHALRLGFDAVAVGEGEISFPDLLGKLQADADWRTVAGIGYFDAAGSFCQTPAPPLVDLNDYPPFPIRLKRFGHIEITRGCPFACAFCQVSRMHGFKPRHRSIDSICQAVAAMRRNGRIDYRFITPNAFGYGSPDGRELRVESVRDFLREVRSAAGSGGRVYFGSFPSEARPEHVQDETVALVKEYADNKNILMGAQSGSNRMLAACHRGHTIEEVYRATSCIVKGGLQAYVDFIFGLPGETDDDRMATISAINHLTKLGARIHTHTFMPVPQTPFAHDAPGKIHPQILELLHQTLLPSGRAYGNWEEQEKLAREMHLHMSSVSLLQNSASGKHP